MTETLDLEGKTTEQLRGEIERLELVAYAHRLHAGKRLLEAQTILDSYVDPRDAYWDDEEKRFWIGVGSDERRKDGSSDRICNEQDLSLARQFARRLAAENEFAISAIENRISYIVGTGFSYRVVAKGEDSASDQDIADAQAQVEAFVDENDWCDLEQEMVRRGDRDGEVFLRFFPGKVGRPPAARVVEPGDVKKPADRDDTWGIRTDAQDVQQVLGYWIDGKFVDVSDVEHLKLNVDRNVKRGIPSLYPVRKNLDRAEKLLRNMGAVATIQAAIAIIRKHGNKPKGAITKFADEQADYDQSNALTGKSTRFKQFGPAEVIDASADTTYEFPAGAIDASKFVAVLQAELRATAARFTLPEFMLSSDASNANYASTEVAKDPAVKRFLREQAKYKRFFVRCLTNHVLDADQRSKVKIEAGDGPSLVVRDRLKENQAREIEVRNKILSPQLWCQELGRNYDGVASDIEAHEERFGAGGMDLPDDRDEGGDGTP